jgi:8-oxo-dGTP pyrophosphatase MutT (NUDIX family)
MDGEPFKLLSSSVVWACPWYSVRRDDLVLPNGRYGAYFVVQKEPAVWVIPLLAPAAGAPGRLALICNYRHTVKDWCWEIPAGSVKPGQSLEAAAREELRQEVGGTAVALEYLGQSYIANGICNEVGHFYLATGVTLDRPQHEAAEVMEVHVFPISEALRMLRAGAIHDAPSALALHMVADRLEASAGMGAKEQT